MADKLSNTAMRAARIRAELKEKSMGVPPPPKVSTSYFVHLITYFDSD